MSDQLTAAADALIRGLETGPALLRAAVFDGALRCVAISPSMEGPPDAIGRPAAEVLPAPVAPALVDALVAVRDGPDDFRYLPALRPPAAGAPVFRVGALRLACPDPTTPPLLAVLGADITTRVAAQARVSLNRERMEMAERLGNLGAWTWWPEEANRWRWSEQLLQLAGFAGDANAPPYAVWLGLLEPEDRGRMLTAREATLAGESREDTVRQRGADGTLRTLRVNSVPSVVDGRVVRVDGVVQDITIATSTAAQQRAVAELGRAALERLDLGELMERASAAVAATLGLRQVTISGAVAEPPAGAVTAIIPGTEGPWGTLAVEVPAARTLSAEDHAFLEAVANVLGGAIARRALETELARQAKARGRLLAEALDAEDRTRREISETLHDGPLQDLLALGQFLARVEPEDERAALHLDRAKAGLRTAIAGLREVMLELHPVHLDVGGLESALPAMAAQQGRLGGFQADVQIEPAARGVRDELVLSLVRELLVNAAKHARADRVDVVVRRSGADLVLEVADDGVGIPEGRLGAALRDGHIGLASSRQRVEAGGGRLDLESIEGAGTRVTAILPAA